MSSSESNIHKARDRSDDGSDDESDDESDDCDFTHEVSIWLYFNILIIT